MAALAFGLIWWGLLAPADHDTLEPGLTPTTLGAHLSGLPQVPAVALYDSAARAEPGAGWRVLRNSGDHADLPLSYRAARLSEFLFALGQDISTACVQDGQIQGKAVWPLADGQVQRSLDYCWRSRLDHSALWQMAVPATAHLRVDLTKAEVDTLRARGADRGGADGRDVFALRLPATDQWTHYCRAVLPYLWQADGYAPADGVSSRIDSQAEAKITAALADVPHALFVDGGYTSTYARDPDPLTGLSDEGLPQETPFFRALRADGTRVVVPGLSLYRPILLLRSSAEGCARFDALDLRDLGADDRDPVALQAALAQALPDPSLAGIPVAIGALTPSDIQRDLSAAITYSVTYFEILPTPLAP